MASGEQNITALPVKTNTGVANSDYFMGIDSAEGYQILIRDVAKYIMENYNGSTLAGSAQTPKAAIDALNSKTSYEINRGPTTFQSDYSVTFNEGITNNSHIRFGRVHSIFATFTLNENYPAWANMKGIIKFPTTPESANIPYYLVNAIVDNNISTGAIQTSGNYHLLQLGGGLSAGEHQIRITCII